MRLSLFRSTKGVSGNEISEATQRCLGLRALLPQSEDASLRVLDLGAARTANLDFFANYGGQLTVADFYSGLRPLRATSQDDDRKRKAFVELLEFDRETRFDLVLAWDLLNYLTPQEHQLLMTTLEPFLVPGTAMLAFVWMQKEMPPGPSHYWVRDEATVAFEIQEGRARPCPRYLEQDLLKRMPSLTVETRYQLRNSMLEYVFSYRKSSRPAAISSAQMRYPLAPAPR